MAPDVDSNPYSTPASATVATSNIASVDFVPIIQRWERLRICYNAILVSFVLLVTFTLCPAHALRPEYWVAIAFAGVIANLCFLTGPAIEGYGTRFRRWNGVTTIVLFLAGLGLTGLLAMFFIASVTGAF